MPVKSPNINTKDQSIAMPTEALIKEPTAVILAEETNENVNKEKLNQMKFMMKTFVLGALREKEQGNNARYNELIDLLTKNPSSPEAPSTLRLFVWINVLSQSVSLLDKSCMSLVEAALQVDWSFRNREFVNSYIDFLENIVSAHAFYIVPILNAIVGGFRFRHVVPAYSKVTRSVSYERHHEALQCILQLIPTGVNSLVVCLVRHMPHKRFNTAEQAAYLKNIYTISEYVPVIRRQILGLAIDQMVRIDAQIQIELDEIQEDVDIDPYDMNFDNDYMSEMSEDEEDEDNEDDDDESIDSIASLAEKNDTAKEISFMVRKLDAMMNLSFQYFTKCYENTTVDVQNDIFYAMVDIFDRVVLKTLKSRYTQFLLFYFCSLNVAVYSDHFLQHLIHHITDPLKPSVTRVAASAYISSYVARAKFLESSTIQRTILTLSSWCESYVDQNEPTMKNLDCNKHDVFYAVVQAIMYIFCFRWRDLVLDNSLDIEEDLEEDTVSEDIRHITHPETGFGSAAPRVWCLGLRNIPRLVMSRLNPLKICSPAVVRQFAKIARSTHFMYVYPILEKNREIFVSGLGMSNTLQTVQTFFPFDPYKLESSRGYIDRIYFEWIAEDDDEDDSSGDEDSEDESDEDVTHGIMSMSISPSPMNYLE